MTPGKNKKFEGLGAEWDFLNSGGVYCLSESRDAWQPREGHDQTKQEDMHPPRTRNFHGIWLCVTCGHDHFESPIQRRTEEKICECPLKSIFRVVW